MKRAFAPALICMFCTAFWEGSCNLLCETVVPTIGCEASLGCLWFSLHVTMVIMYH